MVPAVDQALDEVLAVDPELLGDEELHEVVVGMTEADSRFAAARARLVAAWDARRVWASDGSKAAGARLARDARCSTARARAEVARARALRSMPATEEAFRDGALSADHVDSLRHVRGPEVAEQFAEAEQELVSEGKRLQHDEFVRNLARWRDAADDDAAEDRALRQEEGRHLEVADLLDGVIRLRGELAGVGGALYKNELARLERQLFEQDWAEAKERWGDDVTTARLARTARQRRADAQVLMAQRSASLTGDAPLAHPVVSIVVGLETFRGRVCELLDGTVLTPGQVARTVLDAEIERVVFDGPSRVIDVGRRSRLFTGALRRAIVVRDRCCQFDGCSEPAEACHVDHLVEWTDGGETSEANGRLLCPTHNRQRPGRTTPTQDEGP